MCWVTGKVNSSGYSQIWDGKRRHLAHRFMYAEWIGLVPEDLELDHLCRNGACWNPWHLEPVPHEINVQRGRLAAANRARLQPTHCPKNHEYTPANTARRSNGKRYCRACRSEYDRNRLPRTRTKERA